MSEREIEEANAVADDDLVDFAQNLDIEDYLEDLEFRQALCILRGRAEKLASEERAFKKQIIADLNASIDVLIENDLCLEG